MFAGRALAFAALVFVHAHGDGATVKNVEVVLAHYNEDLGWLSKLSKDVTFTVYNKDPAHVTVLPAPVDGKVVQLPNVGRETHTYLHHIVQNYDKLAPWTVFSQAGEPSFGYRGHREGGGHMLAGDDFGSFLAPQSSGSRFIHTAAVNLPSMNHILRASYCINDDGLEGQGPVSACPMEWQWTPWFDIGDYMTSYILERTREQDGDNVMDFYHKYINPGHTQRNVTAFFPQGARFAVSREVIQRRAKADYEKLLAVVSNHVDSYAGYYMEWFWSEFFQGHKQCSAPPEVAPVKHAEAMDSLVRRFPASVRKLSTGVSGGASGGVSGGASGGVSGGASGGVSRSGPKKVIKVEGTTTLTVENPSAFVEDPSAKEGVKKAIATSSGVQPSEVEVTLSLVESSGRRLAQSVQVDFVITKEVAADDTSSVSTLADTLTAISTEDLAAEIVKEVEAAGGGTITVTVASFVASTPTEITPDDTPGMTTTVEVTAGGDEADGARSISTTFIALLGCALSCLL